MTKINVKLVRVHLLIIALATLLLQISPAFLAEAQDRTDHPRLFFDASEVEAIRTRATINDWDIYEPIRAYVDVQLRSSPRTTPPRDGGVDDYRNFGNRLIAMAMVCMVEQEPRYCNAARNYLLTHSTWEQWGENGLRGLGHSHMVFGVAIAYDWLYHDLTPAERTIVVNMLTRRTQELYEASESNRYVDAWGNWWRRSYAQNHFAVTHSALGIAGLVLLDEDSRAQMWVNHAREKLSSLYFLLEGIGDGSWHEGIAYQNYILTLSLPFAVSLRRNQGDDILPHTYLQNYVYWRLYNYLPNNRDNAFTHGNFDPSWVNDYAPQNILRWVAQEYRNPYAEWTAQRLTESIQRNANLTNVPWYVFELLYHDASVPAIAPTDLPLARTFEDMQGVIWRTGWGNDDLVFALYSGAFGGHFASQTFIEDTFPWEQPCTETRCSLNVGHNHRDANNFSLYRAGTWLIHEVTGTGNHATDLHNTIVIDEVSQYKPPDDHFGERISDFHKREGFLSAVANTPNFDYVAGDATNRYEIPDLIEFTRHVIFVRSGGYFLMLDHLAADSPHRYEWVANFDEAVSVEGQWVRGDAHDGQVVGVGIIAPQPFIADTGYDTVPYVKIRPPSESANARLINLLYPTDTSTWEEKPDFNLLREDETAMALRVRLHDGSTDDVLMIYGQTSTTGQIVGEYRFNGQAAVISRDANDDLQRLFVYGGASLGGASNSIPLLVNNLTADTAFEASYTDDTVAIWGETLNHITLYAPYAQSITINGEPSHFTRAGDYIILP